MKIFGKVEICDHLPSPNVGNMVWRGRSHWSSLALGKQPGTESELFILYQSARNKLGTKYKVRDNIVQVFTKFVGEGKATIRFKSPPHDILVECDPLQLKLFLRTLNLGLQNRLPAKALMFSNASPSSRVPKPPKRKVTILSKHSYPVLEDFPRTCQILKINSVEQKRFDRKILRLQGLKSLDLSDNKLTCLPDELGMLPSLECLYLSNNMFGTVPPNDVKWNWLNGTKVCQNLQVLDLSENEIRALPVQVAKLRNLHTLKVTNNRLVELPSGIGNLSKLRILHAGRNRLKFLPGSLRRLRFDSIDLACNAFEPISNRVLTSNLNVPSLKECAARRIIKSRLHYSSETVPLSMVAYLDNARFCVCGMACFETFARKYVPLELRNITSTLMLAESVRSAVPMDAFYCSQSCVNMMR